MASVLKSISIMWTSWLDSSPGQATANWFMMSSPLPTIIVFVVYVVFIELIGPRLVRKEKPRVLTKTLILYNILQVASNAWIIYKLCKSGWLTHYSRPTQYLEREPVAWMVDVCWFYYITKFFNLFGSVFLVLEKRFEDIYSSSVFYEGFVLLSVWFVVRCFSGEYLSIFMLVDTSVLALDHFFDLFSNIFVKRRPSKLSKLSLTVHMIQSMLILMHTLEILSWNFANVPGPIVAWITINSVLLFSLLPSKFRQSRSKKVNKESECEYTGYSIGSTTVSFNQSYGSTNTGDAKKRYITTLKAQV